MPPDRQLPAPRGDLPLPAATAGWNHIHLELTRLIRSVRDPASVGRVPAFSGYEGAWHERPGLSINSAEGQLPELRCANQVPDCKKQHASVRRPISNPIRSMLIVALEK